MNYYAKICKILCPVSNLVTIVLLKDLFQLCHVPLLYGTGGLPHFIVYKYDFICIYRFTGTTLFNNVTFTFLYLYYFCYLILYILWTWVWNKIINQSIKKIKSNEWSMHLSKWSYLNTNCYSLLKWSND